MKERHIIAAVCDGGGIGYNGDLIVRISADMKHFKELTLGNVVIMGRKTYESIGKPLNCRDNIVVTSKDLNIEGVHCVRSLEDAYRLAEKLDGEKVFVIGGGQLYEAAMPYTDYLDITEIAFLPHRVDTYFPEISVKEWTILKRTERYFTKDTPPYRYVTYKRKVFPVAS
jgi:dihydrofolate reductase